MWVASGSAVLISKVIDIGKQQQKDFLAQNLMSATITLNEIARIP